MSRRTRVLIVDDSALVRALLTDILASDPELEVVGTAPDPYLARGKIKTLLPDVLTLDVEMPRMDGLTFLKNLMRLRPMPVVMISSYTQDKADVTLQALELGAVDYVAKPTRLREGLQEQAEEIIRKVKTAANVPRTALERVRPTSSVVRWTRPGIVVGLGASTGGTEAIRTVLSALPADCPPLLIVQHIASAFTHSFARRLQEVARPQVRVAEHGLSVEPGRVLLAPGDCHLGVERVLGGYRCAIFEGERIRGHRPSVDYLLESLAAQAGSQAVGVLLTGMGDDGVEGLAAIRKAGGQTLVQDEATSVVWGMPGEADRRGLADQVLPLEEIAGRLLGG